MDEFLICVLLLLCCGIISGNDGNCFANSCYVISTSSKTWDENQQNLQKSGRRPSFHGNASRIAHRFEKLGGLEVGLTCEEDCLKAHNEYLAKHGSPPLKWNKQLKADTQTWADSLAKRVLTEFEKDCLKAHNEYRAKHGTPPMKWSHQLKTKAQTWAYALAKKDVTPPDFDPGNSKNGENIAWLSMYPPTKPCHGPKTSSCTQCREIIKDWYEMISDYDFKNGRSKPGGIASPFTQVVWRGST